MIRDDIKAATITAMKGGDKETTATLRLAQAAIKNRDIEARTGGAPSDDDALVTEVLQKMVKQRRESAELYRKGGREDRAAMPLEKVRKVLKIAKEPISLETPIGDEEDSHLGDFIEDKNAVIPVDAAIQSNLKETVTRVLASLTPREERVLRMVISFCGAPERRAASARRGERRKRGAAKHPQTVSLRLVAAPT